MKTERLRRSGEIAVPFGRNLQTRSVLGTGIFSSMFRLVSNQPSKSVPQTLRLGEAVAVACAAWIHFKEAL